MLEDKIYQDYVSALKAKDRPKSDFLSFIRAEIKNTAIELKKGKLEDNEVLTVLKKQKKRLEESKESILPSGRADLIEGVEKELSLLGGYLPQELSETELLLIIEGIITATGATSIKDMGKVMKEAITQAGARTDAKKISELVRLKLSGR
jgi:uncharacterized protein YqeY